MIVVAIAAILASVALPMYRTYVMRGRIIDGTSRLSEFRVRMEQYFMDNRTYANGGACGVANPADTSEAAFTIACSGASATAYTVKATGKSTKGMNGFEYQIIQTGAKTTVAVPSRVDRRRRLLVAQQGRELLTCAASPTAPRSVASVSSS